MMQHPILPPAAPVVRESAIPPVPRSLATCVSLNVAQVTHVALRGLRSSMIFLQTKGLKYFLFIQNNSPHIIRVVVASGPLAVVAEVAVLMDMEPVHHVGGEAAQVEAEYCGLRG